MEIYIFKLGHSQQVTLLILGNGMEYNPSSHSKMQIMAENLDMDPTCHLASLAQCCTHSRHSTFVHWMRKSKPITGKNLSALHWKKALFVRNHIMGPVWAAKFGHLHLQRIEIPTTIVGQWEAESELQIFMQTHY